MTKRLQLIKELFLFLLLLSICLILSVGENFSSTVISGISLWFFSVFPSLFPYFFITSILSSLSATRIIVNKISPFFARVFNLSGSVGYAFIMSLICGYPMGAKIVSDLKKEGAISEIESVRGSALCSSSSPMFLIASVGTIMFSSKRFGLVLFATHLISVIFMGVIFSFYKRSDRPNLSSLNQQCKKIDNILYESAFSAVISVLVVGALITIFYLLTEILVFYKVLSPITKFLTLFTKNDAISSGLVLGAFECTKGLKVLSTISPKIALPYCAFICGFGGLSVIFQSVAYLKSAKIKIAPFLVSKCVQAILSFILGVIFCRFL